MIMFGYRRWLLIKLLLSLFLISGLVCMPSVAYAHGGVADGHEQSLYTGLSLNQGWLTLFLLACAGILFVFYFRRQQTGLSLAPVHGIFTLVAIASVVTVGALGIERQEQMLAIGALTANSHEVDEGLLLTGDMNEESIYAGRRCSATDPVREYDVVAIALEITLNRYLDYDPEGRMYVLEEGLERVEKEVVQNDAARADQAEAAVTAGLQGDAIQPLILRVNQGECLRIHLRNGMAPERNEPVSFHLHGSSLYLVESGDPAIASNPEVFASSDSVVTYEWFVGEDEPEGTHYFHSHGMTREQTNHGLFGAVIVEPANSRYIDSLSGDELRSGWAAIIEDPNGSNFREFALIYHEIGTERFRHRNRFGQQVELLDRFTASYKPGGRALNYRSEPFMNRLELEYKTSSRVDHSMPYSSYSFGDPATPIARSYLGDPVKQRLLHGGSEVFHVHHVHGGAIRWRRQPDAEPSSFDHGFEKQPPLLPLASERIDSQSIGPSETYDVENECGSGGCQQSVGDYLFHCHVAHHYIAGMWGIWRVYNTLQDETIAQDELPPLQELPDRQGAVKPAVTSQELVGRQVDWKGKGFEIEEANLSEWVEQQLPPPGVPKEDDASVLDWAKQGGLYLNEVESADIWPGYRSDAPGTRLPFYFDPNTGKLAYPFLRPHLGKRPPFAPNHGPAPFLDPISQGTDLPPPGENGPWSLCPAGTRLKQFTIHAITLPLTLSQRARLVDPVSQLYVLKQDEEEVRANNGLKTPLAIRANAGEDCVDIIFKSELKDTGENFLHSKVSLHIHFVQFDVQASDGINAGFNYEQSVRPFTIEGETLQANVSAGDLAVELRSAERFQPGILVGIGMDENETFEVARIQAIEGNTITFEEPLQFAHAQDEVVSIEFLRQRWYPDVQFGTAYFHDHVSALTSWKHGLFGALIAEPPGSTYHDPHSGEVVESGPVVDVHTENVVSTDIVGSFRELVLFLQDDIRLTHVDDSSGSAINMRVEPLKARGGEPEHLFSSTVHGDPETPILESYLGDPMVIRSLVPATHDVHTLHVDGHWFRLEPFSSTSPPINTVHLGISERYDLMIPGAGGPQRMPGDYLYYNGRSFKLREGSWGLIRVHDTPDETTLQPLPGHEAIPPPAEAVCPTDAAQKRFEVAAIQAPLPMLNNAEGKLYVLEKDKSAVRAGDKAAEPLVLHVNVGDCIVIHLTNETEAGSISFHTDMLAANPQESLGIEAGFNLPQTVLPGESRDYTYYAHPEVGETVATVRDWGNVLVNPGLGLYGAIVVGATGSLYSDPLTGADMAQEASWRVDVHPPGAPSFRDFTLFMQDEDEIIGTAVMPYSEVVAGVVGLNYQKAPLVGLGQSAAANFQSAIHGDPATPRLEAFVGDAIKLHVLLPYSEQAHVFNLEGHQWPLEPGRPNSDLVSSLQVGALEAITIVPLPGAGGAAGMPGDYLYGDHREPFREAGLWGLLRVYAPDATDAKIQALPVR
jgi:manganese oxidase